MHGGAVASLVDLAGSAAFFAGGSPATGVSLDITVSFLGAARANVRACVSARAVSIFGRILILNIISACIVLVQEEIEIEAKVLGIGERTGCVTVEVRRKSTGEVLAHGRHTKYLAVSSKL